MLKPMVTSSFKFRPAAGGTHKILARADLATLPRPSMRSRNTRWPTWLATLPLLALVLALGGCFATQVFPTLKDHNISLRAGDLDSSGIAFITPSTATGQEEEKQALALIFANTLASRRPQVRIVGLADALSAINKAGLADAYKRMYNDYRDTGLFNRELLKRVGESTGTRYIAQLKLQEFRQGAKERFGALGFRIVETRYANIRLFFQIWDSQDGTIAWEGMQEMFYARDRFSEEPVTLQTMIGRTARDLVDKLP